jgi:hypothetical protein
MSAQFNRYVNVSAMKHYFNVSNKYVVNKLFIVLFPWRHRPWSRQQQPMATSAQSGPMFLPPREDINSPDMYIPVMAFVTYILLSTLLAGLQGAFRPELLGLTATNAFAVVIIELLLLKLGTYLLNISNESQWLDLVAYSGYKFVGIIFTITLATIMTGGKGTGGYVGWSVFAYTYLANAFFLVSSLLHLHMSCILIQAAPFAQICHSAGYCLGRPQPYCPLAEDKENLLPLCLLVHYPVGLYVVAEQLVVCLA